MWVLLLSIMFEFHGRISHCGGDNTTHRFRKRWIDDCFTRDTVAADELTIYIDRYDAASSSLDPYTRHDDLVIVVEGVIHDLIPDGAQQVDVSVATATAGEIIASAYQHFGWQFPQQLLGDYRFLLFDRSQQRLLAGRDKTTYDPIYVAADKQTTLVSTDLLALATEIGAPVNTAYLGEYLTGTIESPYQTFYTNINRIPPGCVVLSSPETTTVQRYYHPTLTKRAAYRQKTRTELGAILRHKLETALNCRIAAAEKAGVFMSGGADSTAIASLVTHQEPSLPVKTYSYTYPNTAAINEVDGINATVTKHALRNERISLADYWVLQDHTLYQHAWATAPAVDPLVQPKAELLDRAAADHQEIILVGDRGNMFDGHRLSIADALCSGHVREAITTARADPVYTTGAALVRYGIAPSLSSGPTQGLPPTRVQEPVRSRLTAGIRQQIEARRQSPRTHDSLQCFSDQATYRSVTSPLADYRSDFFRKLAKYRGLKVVDPYQDARLVEFVFNLPPTYNLHEGDEKAIFRTALHDILPQYMLSRHKTDRVEEAIANGLRRERTYLTSLVTQRHLTHRDVVRQQSAVPDITTAIERFGNITTAKTYLWEYLSAQAWLEDQETSSLSETM